jgi:hypothetical protein
MLKHIQLFMEVVRQNKAYIVRKSYPPYYSYAISILGVTSLPRTDCGRKHASEVLF